MIDKSVYKTEIRAFEYSAATLFFVTFFFLRHSRFFFTLIVLSLIMFIFPNWLIYYLESKRRKALEKHFPDFIRDLSSSIKAGKPLPLAISDTIDNDYEDLNPYVEKIYYQIQWGVPAAQAFKNFGQLTGDPTIKRSTRTVIEAIKSGGELEVVLDAIYRSLLQIRRIEEERESMTFHQIVENYIIFLVFLMIMIVLQNMLLPLIQSMATNGSAKILFQGASSATQNSHGSTLQSNVKIDMSSFSSFISTFGQWLVSINGIFMNLVLIQGFFSGLIIGKFSSGEGSLGTKHSFVLISIGLIAMSLAQSFVKK